MSDPSSPMTLEEAKAFIDQVPWRWVQQRTYPDTPVQAPPDRHQYVIATWAKVPERQFNAFAATVRAKGHKGRYSPPYSPGTVLTNTYLEISGDDGAWIYWHVYPDQVCRQRAEHRQYTPIPTQTTLEVDR